MYLQLCPLPENFQPVSPVGCPVASKGSYPLRHQLFNWMLPVDDGGDGTNDALALWSTKTTSRYLYQRCAKMVSLFVLCGVEPL